MSIGRWTRGLAGIAFFGALVSSSQACIESEGALYIRQALEAPTDATVDADACGEVGDSIIFANVGVITDAGGTTTLLDLTEFPVSALICIQNHLRSRSDNGVETSNIILYQYDVTLSGGDTTEHAIAGSIPASGEDGVSGFEGSSASLGVELLTRSQVASLAGGLGPNEAAEEIASVKVYGRTTGGLEVESPEFAIPVRVYRLDTACSCGGGTDGGFACAESDPGCQ